MDVVAISCQKHTNKKGNKENAQPAHGSKSFIKRDKTTVAPFQLKSNEKQETLTKPAPLKIKTKEVDSISSKPLKKMNTVQKVRKEAVSIDVQAIAAEVAKPSAVMPPRSAPGMYKGKIVQSKIGSIWKTSAMVGNKEPKLSATESQRIGNVSRSRSGSVGHLPRCETQKHGSRPVLTRPTVSSCRPARTVPVTAARTSSRNTTVAPTKASGSQTSKTNISVAGKVIKPSVSSKLSQYRLTMETTEQKRAKLAEWLASKGKTLKRPAMTTSVPPKTKVSSKPCVEQGSRPHVRPQSAVESKPKIKQAHKPDSAATARCADTQEEQFAAHRQTPELLENSDADGLDDIVVNLCTVLEAMATPSRCNDDLEQETDNVEKKYNSPKEECKKEKLQHEIVEHFEEQETETEQVKNESEESPKQEVETEEEEDEVEGDKKGVNTPHMENASVVKYSVKTTPYLQSVKKTIEGESCTSRKKSNIKDLKFLTPVRRSCRIQRKSSHLPAMLVDHDPCVSSLAELVKLDDDANAYIYRKNPALIKDLPDQC